MTPVLLVANAAPSISIELGAAVAWLLGVIAVLLGVVVWFLRREIKNNDEAHRDLGQRIGKVADAVRQLLVGQARIEGLLEGMLRRAGLAPLIDEVRRSASPPPPASHML